MVINWNASNSGAAKIVSDSCPNKGHSKSSKANCIISFTGDNSSAIEVLSDFGFLHRSHFIGNFTTSFLHHSHRSPSSGNHYLNRTAYSPSRIVSTASLKSYFVLDLYSRLHLLRTAK